MKKPENYTISEIDQIWFDMQPGSLTKAYALMKLKCEHLEKSIKILNEEVLAESSFVSFTCSHCGKNFKTKSDTEGHRCLLRRNDD